MAIQKIKISIFIIVGYGIHSILYQRAVYPSETFEMIEKFGVRVMLSQDDKIIRFINSVLSQMQG